MEKLIISSSGSLGGTVRVSGAKNATLPVMTAALMGEDPIILSNVPHLRDVTTLIALLRELGAGVTLSENLSLEIDPGTVCNMRASYELVKTMRASVLVLGPLLSRFGYAEVSLPGGCAIGARPVDLHLSGMEALGAEITLDAGYIKARAPGGRLRGGVYRFPIVSVTGTANVLCAAVLAKGPSRIENAAREPEVVDVIECLNKMGAKISGAGTSVLEIEGVDALNGCEHHILPDRIEAGTFLVAGAMTRGSCRLEGAAPDTMHSILEKLREAGAKIKTGDDWIELDMEGRRPESVNIVTEVYPGFPTDMQAQFMVMNCLAHGTSTVTETIFENRMMHVSELMRMGAKIILKGNTATIDGVERFVGAPVMATDLRASASLVLAGTMADGDTTMERIYHIDRGYECIEEKLHAMGAKIQRVNA